MWDVELIYLDVIVGVPVRVVDDDGVSGGEIDAQTASSGREEESKLRSTGSWKGDKKSEHWQDTITADLGSTNSLRLCLTIKAINGFLSQIASDSSINSLIFVSFILQEVLQKVKHFGHLREDQNPVAPFLQLPHHLLQQCQFSRRLGQSIALIHAIWKFRRFLQSRETFWIWLH